MRHLIALSIACCVHSGQAQHLTISNLLSLTHCQDTTCASALAKPMGMCMAMGEEEDGWLWLPCGQRMEDFTSESRLPMSLGFFGYPRSNYYQYIIGTHDTAYAATLTEELEWLGFKPEKPHPEGLVYLSSEYPALEMQRLERHHTNIIPRKPTDPKGQFNKPLEQLSEDHAAALREQGFDSYDEVPGLLWLFRVHARK